MKKDLEMKLYIAYEPTVHDVSVKLAKGLIGKGEYKRVIDKLVNETLGVIIKRIDDKINKE